MIPDFGTQERTLKRPDDDDHSTNLNMITSQHMRNQRTEEAVRYLQKVKPIDGWSVTSVVLNNNNNNNSGQTKVILRRRNIPLVEDTFFEEIFHDTMNSGSIFGVVSYIVPTESSYTVEAHAIELVHSSGQIIRNPLKILHRITITLTNHLSTKLSTTVSTCQPNSPTNSISTDSSFTEEDNKQLLSLGLKVVTTLILFKILFSSLLLYLVFLPLLILYAMQTCPHVETFDAKKELKRVLRGKYLSDGKQQQQQQQQPKDWLSKTILRVQASIGTEFATGLGGYETHFIPIMGIFIIATVSVPFLYNGADFIWIGVWNRWIFVMKCRPRDVVTSSSTTHLRPPQIH